MIGLHITFIVSAPIAGYSAIEGQATVVKVVRQRFHIAVDK